MKRLLIFALTISLWGCDLLKDEKEVIEYYDIGGLETGCKLSGDQFENILKEDIESSIKCLEDSLKQFSDYVRRENPNYIKRTELEKFVNRFFPEDAVHINKILRPGFKVVSLLLKDPAENLAVNNITLVGDIIRVINQQGRELSDLLKVVIEKAPADRDETDEEREARVKRNGERYWQYKDQMLRTTRSMVGRLNEIISKRPDNGGILDVPELLEVFKIALELNYDQFDVATIKSCLFAKKLLIGGDAYQLQSNDVRPLLIKAPDLLEVALDTLFMGQRPSGTGDE